LSDYLIISGTNRDEAISPTVAKTYQELLGNAGITTEIIDLRQLPADYISSALYANAGSNQEFNPIRDKMKQAHKYVFVIPEYNGSFPGVLKAFVDGLEFPLTFTGKKAALVGVSSGLLGSTHAMSHFTDILNYCGTHVLARKPRLTKISQFLQGDKLINEQYIAQLEKQIKEFITF
jgi:chromate reductase